MEIETKKTQTEEKKQLILEKVKIKDIVPYPNNPKLHSSEQIEKIRDSILQFGYNDPIALDENNVIIEGHGRLEALKQINSDPDMIIQVIRLTGLDENAKKAYRIAHNKLNMATDFDLNILKEEFYSLEDTDYFEDTGFSTDEITEIWDKDKAKEDDFEMPKEAKYEIELGEIWQLGDHRLMCGDSTEKSNVDALMGGKEAILMVTDPPYGVSYDPKWRDAADKKGLLGNRYPTRSMGEVPNDNRIDWSDAYSLFNGDVMYVWHAGKYASEVAESIKKVDFELINQIIWVKPHFILSRGDYHWKHEPCWYAVRKGKKHNFVGDRSQTTVWEIKGMNCFGGTNDKSDERTGHGTQKPLKCMSIPIINNSKEKDNIYDPFGGLGSTLIACEQLKRKCYMMELDPYYCSVIIERWEKLTNKQAIKLTNLTDDKDKQEEI